MSESQPSLGTTRLDRTLAVSLAALVLIEAAFIVQSRAFSTEQSASLVIGQIDFTSRSASTSVISLSGNEAVAFDNSGNLWAADTANNRVLEFLRGAGFTSGESASLVLGQSGYTQSGGTQGASGLSHPSGIAFDSSENLWVSDSANNRVLEYNPPFTSYQSASLVLGQPNLATGSSGTSATGLSNPVGLAFDPGGNLWVVDENNNRVLRYAPPFTSGESASMVIGQPDLVHGGGATTATGLRLPTDVAFDSAGDLWAVDQYNDRVLKFAYPLSTGEAASLVIGQTDYTSPSGGTSATFLHLPVGIAFDSKGNLWIADATNNRILEFGAPFATDEAASLVIGQSDFTSSYAAATANGLQSPMAVALDPTGNLWTADTGNNRVLEYQGPAQTSTSTVTTTVTSTSTVTSTATTYITSTAFTTSTVTSGVTSTSTSTVTSATTKTLTSTATSTQTVQSTQTQTQTQTQTISITSIYTTNMTSTSTATVTSTSVSTGVATTTSTVYTTVTRAPSSSSGPDFVTVSIAGVVAAAIVVAYVLVRRFLRPKGRRILSERSSWQA